MESAPRPSGRRLSGLGLTGAFAGCEAASTARRCAKRRVNLCGRGVRLALCKFKPPAFTAHDHPALRLVGNELGVKVQIAGPNSIDIPSFVAAIEQTAARKPAGMMVVGWDPSALVPPINKAVESGVPVVCVDADVPASKRLAFIGTDWYDLGVRQGEAMVKALAGRRGKVALLGLIEQAIDQQAFAGFRSIIEKAGLVAMEPQQDKGNQAEAGACRRRDHPGKSRPHWHGGI
jgi:ABC-type sugar transport system substrate-binding protein